MTTSPAHLTASSAAGRIARPRRAEDWRPAIEEVLDGRGLELFHQPIVDLQGGRIVGFECLARFDGPIEAPPDVWFAAADALGLGAELEAAALRIALDGRRGMPANCFVSVNVTPNHLFHDAIQQVLADGGDLRGVVLELTEHHAVGDLRALGSALAEQRQAGAMIAIDDAGAGYAGLQWLMSLSPDIIKLDRELVAGVDRDEVRRALVDMLGAFAGRIDARLLAEGVEETAELEVVASMGVPLGQGYRLGRATSGWPLADQEILASLGTTMRARHDGERVGRLVESVPHLRAGRTTTAEDFVVIDEHDRPLELHTAGTGRHGRPMRVQVSESVADVLLRATTRPPVDRWRPMVGVDADGRSVGIIRMERLIHAAVPHTERA